MFYNTQHPLRFKKVSNYAAGNPDSKIHGLKITALLTVTDPELYSDLGFGKKAEHINLLLSGDLPCKNPFTLEFSQKNGLFLKLTDEKLRVPCTIDEIETSALLVDHWDMMLKIDCPETTDLQAGKLVKLEKELVYSTIETTQETIMSDTVEITVKPQAPIAQVETGSIFDKKDEEEEEDKTDRGLSNPPPKVTTRAPKQRPEHFQHVKGKKKKSKK